MQIDKLRLRKKIRRARAILTGTRAKISTYLLERGYPESQVSLLDTKLQRCTSREQIFLIIKAALEKRVWPDPVTYNVLIEIPEDTGITEQHEVEYEAEVPVMKTVEYEVEVEIMETVIHTEEWVDEEGETQVITWETKEPTGEYETVTKTYQEPTGETEIVTKTDLEYSLGDDLALEIAELYTKWPADDTPGCIRDAGKKLLHCQIKTAVKDVETYLRVLFHTHDLKWTLVHIQTFHGVVPVMGTDSETGEDIVIGYRAELLYTKPALIAPYVAPRYEDEAETIELKKDISWLHVYQGQAPWRIK